jgi:hypothetical protein
VNAGKPATTDITACLGPAAQDGPVEVKPRPHPRPAEEQDPEGARFEEERGEGLIGESGPWIGPDMRDSSLQLVPNSNASTTLETTPHPNATPKIFSQNSKATR